MIMSVVMLHGSGLFSHPRENTAEGREGLRNIFLRHRLLTYLVDHPRRGRARHAYKVTVSPTPDKQR